MNKDLQNIARQYLKDGLELCTDGNKKKFKQMYSHDNPEKDINAVVDDLPSDKLDWAMTQVKNTLAKSKGA